MIHKILIFLVLIIVASGVYAEDYSAIYKHNIFKSYSMSVPTAGPALQQVNAKELEKQRLLAQMEEIKNNLMSNLVVTGTMKNAAKVFAVIKDNSTSTSGLYSVGQSIKGAVITRIDQATNSVTLKYQDVFEIVINNKK